MTGASARHIVAAPRRTEWAIEIARALDERGWLRTYETGFIWPNGAAGQTLATVARRLGGRAAERAIELRMRPSLRAPVHAQWSVDLFRTAASAAGWRRIEDRLWEWDDHRFAAAIARAWPDEATAVHAFEHGALEILEAAHNRGAAAVLHTASLHPREGERLMEIAVAAEPGLRVTAAYELHERRHARDRRREREYQTATLVTAPSTYAARALTENGVPASKVFVLPFGGPPPNPHAASQPMPSGGIRILYAGRIGAHKGCHLLADAWRRIDVRDARLTFVGALGLPPTAVSGPGIDVRAPLPQAELHALMRASDVVVLPTLGDTFGLVVTEALANGVPVLVSNNAGAADLVQPGVNGWKVPAGDVDPLVERLSWIVDSPDQVRAMRRGIVSRGAVRTWADFRRELQARMIADGLAA